MGQSHRVFTAEVTQYESANDTLRPFLWVAHYTAAPILGLQQVNAWLAAEGRQILGQARTPLSFHPEALGAVQKRVLWRLGNALQKWVKETAK